MFSLTFGKRLSFVYLEVCSLYSVVCLSPSTLEDSSLLMWIALFPSLPLLMVFSFVSTLPFYLSMYMPLAEHWSCLYVVPVDILVHISLAEVGDFLRGMFAAVEWLEWVQEYAQLFKKGCISLRLHQPVQVSRGVISSPAPRICTLYIFCIKLFLGENNKSLGLHFSCCLCFIPWSSQYP